MAKTHKNVQKALDNLDTKALALALTPRQRAFAHEYVVDYDATKAAVRAGYASQYANRQGYQLVKHPGVSTLIDHLTLSKEAKLTAISPEYVLQQVTSIIQKVDAKDGDKLRGLELLARHLGMFIERTEISGKDGSAIEINQRRIEEEAAGFTNLIKGLKDRSAEKTEPQTIN